MKTRLYLSLKTLCGCVLLLAALPTRGAAQAAAVPVPQAAPAAQSPQRASLCGGQPICYETSDFAAIITDFRMSNLNGFKIIDTTVHFQNKTSQPLTLGYAEGSAMALDDQGNRYALNGYAGPNAVRGIGRVVGSTIDPKFVLQPGGVGDALFELAWRQGGTEGVSLEMDLTIREITSLEGRQFALAGEFPLQFKGLANGMFATPAGQAPGSAATAFLPTTASAGGVTAALPVCGPAVAGIGNTASTLGAKANSIAGQNVSAGANSAISNATTSISNLKSMFGRKKAAAATTPVAAAGGAPCVPAAAGAAASVSPVSAVAGAAPAPAANAAVSTTTTTTTTTTAARPVRVAAVTAAAPARATKATVSTTTATKKAAAKKPAAAPVATNP